MIFAVVEIHCTDFVRDKIRDGHFIGVNIWGNNFLESRCGIVLLWELRFGVVIRGSKDSLWLVCENKD